MTKITVVSISHSIDPDGIGSQAILHRYFKELNIKPISFLADYYNFEKIFQEALKLNPSVLIISDIGLNRKVINEIIEPLRNLEARKIWIDHHKAPSDLKELIKEAVDEFIHDISICAAELVQKRFLPNDEISKKIAEIAHNGDFDVPDRLADIYYTLIDYYRYSVEDLERIRDIFIEGKFEDPKIMEEYLGAYRVFEAERDRIKNELEVITLGGKTISFAYSHLIPRGKMTKYLAEISEEDINLAIDTTNFRIGLRSESIDVAAVAAKFGGGGHKHRSGFTFNNALNEDNNLVPEFLDALEEAIKSVQETNE
jgi:oligoribonuclease NrnB/cAMP/cGMP phosphodiesterase (DHH superfamily)